MKFKSLIFSSIILVQAIFYTLEPLALNLENPAIYWQEVGDMITPREFSETVAYNDKIYVFGGEFGNDYLDNAECYDPKTGEWTVLPNMPIPRTQFGLEVINDKIYCFGGMTKEGGLTKYSDRVDIYNPQTNTWEIDENIKMPTKRGGFQSVRVGETIYFISGKIPFFVGDDVLFDEYTGLVEMYNIKTNTWETKTSSPFKKVYFSAYYYDGKIYCEGGRGSKEEERYIYDIKSDSWTTGYSPVIGHYSRAVMLKDYVFFVGGSGISSSGINFSDRIYDIKNDLWSPYLRLKPLELNSFDFDNSYATVINDEAYYFGVGRNSELVYKLSLEDKSPPVMKRRLSPDIYTNTDVQITVTAKDNTGVKRIILPNGNSVFSDSVVFSVSSNGTYSFFAEDFNQNVSTILVKVNYIDKNSPSVSILKNPNSNNWTNKDIEASIVATD